VDQVQVEVVQADALQRRVEGPCGVLLAGVLKPQLGGDEQLLAGNAALGDSAANGLLVAVGGGGVEQPVPGGEGVDDDLLGLLGLLGGDLEDPETEDGHRHAVVHSDLRDIGGHSAFLCEYLALVDEEYLAR
jgi:hypothetical protein